MKIQKYKEIIKGQNYDRFDEEIEKSVKEWNFYFKVVKYPPSSLLDPNLVKAIIYIESRMGYGADGFPDVMQVGDPQDDAIHVLSNDGEKSTEYDASSGKLIALDYNENVKVSAPAGSIYWGVRWLYHKLQRKITQENAAYKPIWGSWREATKRYGPGTEEYVNKVWNLYKNGINPDGGDNLFENKERPNLSFPIFIAFFSGSLLLGALSLFNLNSRFNFSRVSLQNARQKELMIKLEQSINKAIKQYSKQGMSYSTWRLFYKLKQQCEQMQCDSRLTFTPHLENFIEASKNLKDFLTLVRALDFVYPASPRSFDLDNDGEKEIILIKTDSLNPDEAELLVIDQAKRGEKFIVKQKLANGYFYSPDSLAIPSESLEIFDLTADGNPEIILFSGNARGGAGIQIFQYGDGKLREIFQDHNLIRPTYTFSDQNYNKIPEIIIRGQTLNKQIRKEIYEYDSFAERFISI